MKFSLQNFVIDLYGSGFDLKNESIPIDKVGLSQKSYLTQMKRTLGFFIEDLNEQYKEGYDLKKYYRIISMAAGFFHNTTINPLYEEGFLYTGLSFAFDQEDSFRDMLGLEILIEDLLEIQ